MGCGGEALDDFRERAAHGAFIGWLQAHDAYEGVADRRVDEAANMSCQATSPVASSISVHHTVAVTLMSKPTSG